MMSSSNYEPVQAAEVVVDTKESVKMHVQIPEHLAPGDHFTFTSETGKIISVVVPEGAKPGSFIHVVVPDEQVDGMFDANENKPFLRISKATFGAAVVGIVIGCIVMGPIGGLILGGACAYATTREHGEIGQLSRKVGNKVYDGMTKAKKFVMKSIKRGSAAENAPIVATASTTSTPMASAV